MPEGYTLPGGFETNGGCPGQAIRAALPLELNPIYIVDTTISIDSAAMAAERAATAAERQALTAEKANTRATIALIIATVSAVATIIGIILPLLNNKPG